MNENVRKAFFDKFIDEYLGRDNELAESVLKEIIEEEKEKEEFDSEGRIVEVE